MRFKEWLELDESRFKGFQRQFRQSHPEIPDYVAKQFYYNRLSPHFGRMVQDYSAQVGSTVATPSADPNVDPRIAPTVLKTQTAVGSVPSPIDVINGNDFLKDIFWMKKPAIVHVTPLDFDRTTLNLFLQWRFGFSPKDAAVRNDTHRFDVQRQMLMKQQEGKNEPVVMIKYGNQFKLIEGYHRTMLRLLSPHDPQKGAPPDQVQILQSGDLRQIDLSRWNPVPLRAYIGIHKKYQTNSAPYAHAAMKEV